MPLPENIDIVEYTRIKSMLLDAFSDYSLDLPVDNTEAQLYMDILRSASDETLEKQLPLEYRGKWIREWVLLLPVLNAPTRVLNSPTSELNSDDLFYILPRLLIIALDDYDNAYDLYLLISFLSDNKDLMDQMVDELYLKFDAPPWMHAVFQNRAFYYSKSGISSFDGLKPNQIQAIVDWLEFVEHNYFINVDLYLLEEVIDSWRGKMR